MSRMSLLALPLVGAVTLGLIASASTYACTALVLRGPGACKPAAEPAPGPAHVAPPAPDPEQPKFHTLTIYNGDKVQQQTFVQQGNGSWKTCGHFDVFLRDDPCSPWRYYGTYPSPRRAEQAACSLRANGKPALVRVRCE